MFLKLYNVFFGLFFTVGAGLAFYQVFDVFVTAIVFLWTGEFSSVLQKALERGLAELTFLTVDSWQLHTGLKGFDWLINSFIALQYSTSGRWMMVGIAGAVSILMGFLSSVGYDGIVKDTETGSKWTDAGGLGCYLSAFTVVAPIFWAPQIGLGLWVLTAILN